MPKITLDAETAEALRSSGIGAASGVVYTPIYDEEGNEIGTEPAPQQLTHGWAGWEV